MNIIMEGFLWIFRFMTGACVFSFINVVIFRLPYRESIIHGKSRCPDCGRKLTVKELIPCISFLIQRGKCLGCGTSISKRYFFIECLGGAAFVFCGIFFGCGMSGLISLKGLLAFAYLGILTAMAWIDWDTGVICNRFLLWILLLALVSIHFYPELMLIERLSGMAVVALPMFWTVLLVDGVFRCGDIKLMACSGFLLGWRAMILAAFLGLAAGGIYRIAMPAKGKHGRNAHFVWGPFLAAGLGTAYFYGDIIFTRLLSAFGL